MNKRIIKLPNLPYFCLTIIFFLLLFILNRLTLFTSDDFTYHFIYQGYLPTTEPKRIDGLYSIFISQINHWKLWNGRFVAHSIVQFFLQFKKVYFDVFNSVAYILLINLIMFSNNDRSKYFEPLSYIFLFLFCWFYLPEIGKSVLWVSGSGNYLWTSLIYLSYFLIATNSIHKNPSLIKGLCLIILGFIAGACNENTSPAILLMVISYSFLHYIFTKQSNIYVILSLFSGTAGFLLMMASPGSQKRGHMELSLKILKENIYTITETLLNTYWIPYLLIIFLVLFIIIKKIKITQTTLILLLSMLIGHLSSALALIISPEIPKRTLFGTSIFLAIILLNLFNITASYFNKKITYAVILAIGTYFLFSYYTAFTDIRESYNEVKNQYHIIYQSDENTDIKIPLLHTPKTDYNAYFQTANASTNPNDWFNRWMAVYFNKKSITGY